MVWNDDAAKKILEEENIPQEILQEQNFKQRIFLLADKIPGFTADTVFSNFLSKFLKIESPLKSELLYIIKKIRSYQNY